jgi:hypothetical protein
MVEKEAEYCAHCYLAHFTLTLKVEVVHSSRIFSSAYQTAQYHFPEGYCYEVT